jgi:hypothetical protein
MGQRDADRHWPLLDASHSYAHHVAALIDRRKELARFRHQPNLRCRIDARQ